MSEKIFVAIKSTIDLATKAIANLALHNISDIEKAIQLIANIKGRVVISGIGKSAIVAQKIVATFNSIGTRSLFMHGADAVHGDCGMLHSEDIIIYLSKSGNSSEIDLLIPIIKKMNLPLIAIVSNQNSTLYKNADLSIFIPIEEEADSYNIVPSTSTTCQMVIGDALAMGLMTASNFQPHDFASLHPGGHLGKVLTSNVHALIDKSKNAIASPNTSLRDVIFIITSGRLGACAILEDEKVLGIVTDGDIRRAMSIHDNVLSLDAKSIMTPSPKSINKNMKATEAFRVMELYQVSQLIVLDDEQFVGMIHLHDLIKEGFGMPDL